MSTVGDKRQASTSTSHENYGVKKQKLSATTFKKAAGTPEKKRLPPIETRFTPWDCELPPTPKFNPAWGTTPMPGPEGPKPHPDQPPARTSNAQTVPPLWEDRKFRFKKGSRYVQTFRRGEEVAEDAPADKDQQENLVLKLMDMRPKTRKDLTPRRVPVYYKYQNGLPKDWDNKQTIKALNDRRQQAIDRVTMDPPWTKFEREYLLQIFKEFPDASILEVTERFNWRFKDQDYAKSTAFPAWDYISIGRTIESVRFEYLTHKHKYDAGEIPNKKELADKSVAARAAGENRMWKFGKRDHTLDQGDDDDSDNSDAEGGRKSPKNKILVQRTVLRSDDESDGSVSPREAELPATHCEQSEYSDPDEELLALAGYNDRQVSISLLTSLDDNNMVGSHSNTI